MGAKGYKAFNKGMICKDKVYKENATYEETGNEDEDGNYIRFPKCVKTEYVDGEKIKEDVFYKLIDGEFKEVTKTEE